MGDHSAKSPPIILDGAFGTELERRGFEARLPLWSALALIEAPDLVQAIYRDYAQAGADILTAATFRTTRYTMAKAGLADRAEELTRLAIRLAKETLPPSNFPHTVGEGLELSSGQPVRPIKPLPHVVGETGKGKESLAPPPRPGLSPFEEGGIRRGFGPPLTAASLAPLEDCYRPDLRPSDEVLLREHAHTVRMLRDAGADLILVETQNTAREAQIATEMALTMGLPVWTSLMPKSATELFNGDSLTDAALAAYALGVDAVLVNCCPPDLAEAAFQTLRQALPNDVKVGAYPNFRAPSGQPWDFSAPLSPQAFAEWGQRLAEAGADILGGCCGTTPQHIAALAKKLNEGKANRS